MNPDHFFCTSWDAIAYLAIHSLAFLAHQIVDSFRPHLIPNDPNDPAGRDDPSPTMAHKKAGGATSNGRDSNPKMLGVKIHDGQPAKIGSILIRQRGTQWFPGKNVGTGKDFTLFSMIDGMVKYTQKRQVKFNGQTHYDTLVHVEAVGV